MATKGTARVASNRLRSLSAASHRPPVMSKAADQENCSGASENHSGAERGKEARCHEAAQQMHTA